MLWLQKKIVSGYKKPRGGETDGQRNDVINRPGSLHFLRRCLCLTRSLSFALRVNERPLFSNNTKDSSRRGLCPNGRLSFIRKEIFSQKPLSLDHTLIPCLQGEQ